jgi:hypothetical protein
MPSTTLPAVSTRMGGRSRLIVCASPTHSPLPVHFTSASPSISRRSVRPRRQDRASASSQEVSWFPTIPSRVTTSPNARCRCARDAGARRQLTWARQCAFHMWIKRREGVEEWKRRGDCGRRVEHVRVLGGGEVGGMPRERSSPSTHPSSRLLAPPCAPVTSSPLTLLTGHIHLIATPLVCAQLPSSCWCRATTRPATPN